MLYTRIMEQETTRIHTTEDALAILQWYAEAGVDEAMEDAPVDYFALTQEEAKPTPRAPQQAPAASTSTVAAPAPGTAPRTAQPAYATKATESIIAEAKALAAACDSISALKSAVESFDGCGLKKMATKTVFADGAANAPIMFIGEAPDADEDKEGLPFCGASGQLLDKMLLAIGLNRSSNAYLANAVFWRPPGNRNPNAEELAICRPFIEKHIALAKPKLLVLLGGTAATSLLGTAEGITRLRSKTHSYSNDLLSAPIPAYVLFHPTYLMRQPSHKALAWKDLLAIKQKLAELA